MGVRQQAEPDAIAVSVEGELDRVRQERDAAIRDMQAITRNAEQRVRELAGEPATEDAAGEIER
jgi:hypothetical protein